MAINTWGINITNWAEKYKSIAPALSWINGKPGGVSLWMAHKTIYGINANIILGWHQKFSHLHALNFWSNSKRQCPGTWMRSEMCFCLCYRCAFGFLAYNKCHIFWACRHFNCFVCLIVYCVELHPLRHWHWQINICKLTNEYPELKSSLFNGADWNKWGQMFGSENGPESKDMIYKEWKLAKNIKEIKIYTLAKISKKARK